VYPSPATDNLRINAENMIKRVDIFDITGKRVFTLNDVNKRKLELNVSEFANGLYITNVYDIDGRVVSEKIIKR
ncbi:MAG: T9SS type A sorting domain-containing protein, partial [Bacteroidota bacterium]